MLKQVRIYNRHSQSLLMDGKDHEQSQHDGNTPQVSTICFSEGAGAAYLFADAISYNGLSGLRDQEPSNPPLRGNHKNHQNLRSGQTSSFSNAGAEESEGNLKVTTPMPTQNMRPPSSLVQ